MKEVFTHPDSSLVGLCKNLLEEAGIGCFVRNESSSLVMRVPIPAFDCVLCVLNDRDYEQARSIVDAYRQPVAASGGDWICPHCQAVVPAAFDSCWKCERERPAPTA
jgi:hypothetical protein